LNKNEFLDVSQLLSVFVAQSNDGYVILDADDRVIYTNPYYAESLFGSHATSIIGKTFKDYVHEACQAGRGFKIEPQAFNDWISETQQLRWKKTFRSFEIELFDGRWFLVTEQVIGSRFLFVHATDVTRTKDLEFKLRRTQSQLLKHAYVDELTDIANRRAFIERTGEEINKAQRNETRINLFIFDVDYFKDINDNYGHQAGDTILQSLCQLVSSQLRDYDIIARIGGEEFAIVFTDGDQRHNLTTIERIRKLIECSQFQYESIQLNCTVSFGGTALRPNDRLENLISRADKNLYQAKNQGRNCTVYSE
jgi:diguanylate cyclase (GGDEF)-like protein